MTRTGFRLRDPMYTVSPTSKELMRENWTTAGPRSVISGAEVLSGRAAWAAPDDIADSATASPPMPPVCSN